MNKQIRNLSLIVLVLIFNSNIFGQKINNYSKGHIITESLDTIKGLIKLDFENKQTKILTIKRSNDKIETIEIRRVKTIELLNDIKFQKIPYNSTFIIAKIIVEGTVNLYKNSSGKNQGFILENEEKFLLLRPVETIRINSNSQEIKNIEKVVYPKNLKDTSLVNIYGNCKEKILKKYILRKKTLKHHVIDLNNCLGSSYYVRPTDKIINQFSVLGGTTFMNRRIEIPYSLTLQYLRTNSSQFRKVSLFARMNFLKLTREEKEDLFITPLTVGVQFKLSMGKIQPFLSLGGGVTYSQLDGKSDFSIFPFDLGLGVDIPLNQNFSIRTDLNLTTFFTPSIGVVYNLRRVK